MSRKPQSKPKLTDDERKQRFVETAKKVEASENLTDLDKALTQIVREGKKQPIPR
jgi:hypothetical protein